MNNCRPKLARMNTTIIYERVNSQISLFFIISIQPMQIIQALILDSEFIIKKGYEPINRSFLISL